MVKDETEVERSESFGLAKGNTRPFILSLGTMRRLLLLVALTGVIHGQRQGQLNITGPSIIPVGKSVTYICSSVNTRPRIDWRISFDGTNGPQTILDDGNGSMIVSFGAIITIISNSESHLTINMVREGLHSVQCEASDTSGNQYKSLINITTFGAPAPQNLSIILVNDSTITTSWIYCGIMIVNVTFNLTLTFSESSIHSLAAKVDNELSYIFTINSVRSCEPFKFCISGNNSAGQGNKSCVDQTLPYRSSENEIDYSLSKKIREFSLNVGVAVPEKCLKNKEDSYIFIEVMNDYQQRTYSDPTKLESVSYLQVNGLSEDILYHFRIISNNSIGEFRSGPISFITSDVQRVNICLMNEKLYNISCIYTSGANFTGCEYNLISDSNNNSISDNITNWITRNISNIMEYTYIIVKDSSYNIIQNETVADYDVMNCDSTTEIINTSRTTVTTTIKTSISTAVIVAVVLVIIIVTVIFFVSVFAVIYLLRSGNCVNIPDSKSNKFLKTSTESQVSAETIGKSNDVMLMSSLQEDDQGDTMAQYSVINRSNIPQVATSNENTAEENYSKLQQDAYCSINVGKCL